MQKVQACTICGSDVEDAHHALISCPHAASLWNVMKEVWDIPNSDDLQDRELEWIFRLLEKLTEIQRTMVLMTMWMAWHVHNEITHHKPAIPIEVSRRFLASYLTSFLMLQQYPEADEIKGKFVVDYLGEPACKMKPTLPVEQWQAPVASWAKLNVDGSFMATDGTAGAGMLLRGRNGTVILAAIRGLVNCARNHPSSIGTTRAYISQTRN